MMELYLSKDENDVEIHIRIPAAPDVIWPAITELDQHSVSGGPVRITGVLCPIGNLKQYIQCADLEDEADIQKLNKLAESISRMDSRECALFAGALDAESINGLDDVLRLTEHLGDYVILPNIGSDIELGRILVDTGYKNFPENVRPYLDYKAIGAEYYAEHGGAYGPGGYVRRRDSQPSMESSGKSVFLLHLTAHNGTTHCLLPLPASEDRLDAAKEALRVEEFCQANITQIECSVEKLSSYLTMDAPSVETISEVAAEINALPSEDIRKLCAVCEITPPSVWTEMLELVCDLDDFEFCPDDPEQYGRNAADYLRSDVDALLEELEGYIDYSAFGEQQMLADGVRPTAYGNLRRLSAPLPEEPEPGMRML